MKKVIRIISILATSLAGFSLLLLLISIPFQSTVLSFLYAPAPAVIDLLPQIPILPLLSTLLNITVILLTIFFCGKNTVGIWFDILVIISLAVIIQPISSAANSLITMIAGRTGSEQLTVNAMLSNLSEYCLLPCEIGIILTYLVCGMSIAFKTLSKKNQFLQ